MNLDVIEDKLYSAILQDVNLANGLLIDAWTEYKGEKWYPVIIKDMKSGVRGFEVNFSGTWGKNEDVGRKKLSLHELVLGLKNGTIPSNASIRCKQLRDTQRNGRNISDLQFSSRLKELMAGVNANKPMAVSSIINNNECEISMNTILYGPPGTGKTFKTAELAVSICDGAVPTSREALMKRYEELRLEERISFVTFHQSYGYEDFVEGLRPELKDGQISYRVRPGIFREACAAARLRTLVKPGLTGTPLKERTVYKMSLGRAGSAEGKQALQSSLENGYVLLGWGEDVDFSECKSTEDIRNELLKERPDIEKPDSHARYLSVFKDEMKVGDIIIVSQGNSLFRAIGEVTGGYEFQEAAVAGNFHQTRTVRWLDVFEGNKSVAEIYSKNFVMSALYKLASEGLNYDALELLIKGEGAPSSQNHVLIIDEINRANISKVFGELITLLEPDKREGEVNAITVKLPYSGESFSVPKNIYVIGTMNTADRSIALLDTALRRRFEFEELQPQYEALPEGILAEGIDLRAMLRAMNERIEYLYDRDHTVGHAYFMNVETLADLDIVFRRKIIPLLQEYFYEDLAKVYSVLNENGGFFTKEEITAPKGLDGYEAKYRYIMKDKFHHDDFLNIYA